MKGSDIALRIERIDVALFEPIATQSSKGDRLSWLALQRAVRQTGTSFAYLEIGSHLGGSMQACLRDPLCAVIYSIDKRPLELPDDRGVIVRYPGNSTARMLENLRHLDPSQVAKVRTFDGGVEDIAHRDISAPPSLCFIDGEHTKAAVLRDFAFCLSVCARRAVIYFHDSGVVYTAIAEIVRLLENEGRTFETAKLGGSTFAIGLGRSSLLEDETLKRLSTSGPAFLKREGIKHTVKRFTPRPLLPLARSVGARLYG